MSKYYEWEDFKEVYFEDSYIMSIDETKNEFSITVDMVLLESSPFYSAPKKDEQYCYKIGTIKFENVTFLDWEEKKLTPIIDLDGSIDYGNIYYFELLDGFYHLHGEIGQIKIKSSPVKLIWN